MLGAAVALATAGIVAGAGFVSASDDQAEGVLQAGWGDRDISPLGLIVGVIVAILVLKLLFRLIAGPRWYGGPWAWDHRHAGWHGRFPHDAPDVFRRWHDQAHEQAGPEQAGHERREAVSTDQPTSPPAQPSQPGVDQPPAGEYPSQPSYGAPPAGPYPGQPTYGAYPGQPTYGQAPGSTPPWTYPAPPPYPPPPGQAPQVPYPPQPPQGPYPGGPPPDQRR